MQKIPEMDKNNTVKNENQDELILASFWQLLKHSDRKIFIKDKDLIYRGASPKFALMAGWETENDLIGKTDFEIFEDQELAQRYREDDLKLIKHNQDLINYVEPLADKDGQARYATTSKFVLNDQNGQFMGLIGISYDITMDYYLRRNSIRELEYLFSLPPDTYFAVYVDVDDWRIIREKHQKVNDNEFSGHTQLDTLLANACNRIADRRWPAYQFYSSINQKMIHDLYESGKKNIIMEYRRKLINDEMRWVRDEIHLLEDNINNHLCMMLIVRDIHGKKLEEIERILTADRDELTGLLNRKATMTLIRERLENSLPDEKHALLMIDADHFKSVNDTYGHQAGDEVLKKFSGEISSTFRSTDIVGRIGGDEFFVLMTNVPDRESAEKKTINLLEKLSAVHYEDVWLSASIGISFYPTDSTNLEEMYRKADKAMYNVKNSTRGRMFFAADMNEE